MFLHSLAYFFQLGNFKNRISNTKCSIKSMVAWYRLTQCTNSNRKVYAKLLWNKSYSGKFAKIWANSLLLPQKINCSYTFEANYKLPKNNNHKIFAQISQRISEPRTFRKGNDINFQSLFPIIGKPFDDLYCTIKVKTTFRAHGGCKLSCTPGSYSEFLRFTNSMLCLVRMRSHGTPESFSHWRNKLWVAL